MIFSNEDKENYLKMLVSCIGFRSITAARDTTASIVICQKIGEKMGLGQEEKEILYCAAMLHDIGMIALPKEMIEAPRRLTPEETQMLRTHVMLVENIIKAGIKDDIFDVIAAHHERGDGSGYPGKLKFGQMNLSQQILQVADVFTALTGERTYREKKTKQEVISILNEEADKGRLNREVISVVNMYYDEIMQSIEEETNRALEQRKQIAKQYKLMMELIRKQE